MAFYQCIKLGSGSGGNCYLNTLYSTEEKKIGYWTDGRPLYQISLNPTVSVGDNTIAHNIANLRECVSIFGECKYNNLSEYLPLPYTSKNIRFAISLGNVTPTTFLIGVGDGFSSIQDCFVTLQYTKTNDTPELNPQVGNVIYLPTIYSEEERQVGVWCDGRPLYQKTIDFGSLPASGSKTVQHNIQNLDYIVKIYGTAINSNHGHLHIPFVHRSNINNQVQIGADNTGVTLFVAANQTQYSVCYLTLQYVKTTDTKGSGDWTPSGARAVHYSTNEQVIGTWIDGKPLYERSMALASSVTIGTAWTSLGLVFSSDIETIVDGKLIRNGKQLFACSFDYDDSTKVARTMTFLNNLSLNTDTIVTLQYTKTTD